MGDHQGQGARSLGLGPTKRPGSGKLAEKVGGCKLGLSEKLGVYGPLVPEPEPYGLLKLCSDFFLICLGFFLSNCILNSNSANAFRTFGRTNICMQTVVHVEKCFTIGSWESLELFREVFYLEQTGNCSMQINFNDVK